MDLVPFPKIPHDHWGTWLIPHRLPLLLKFGTQLNTKTTRRGLRITKCSRLEKTDTENLYCGYKYLIIGNMYSIRHDSINKHGRTVWTLNECSARRLLHENPLTYTQGQKARGKVSCLCYFLNITHLEAHLFFRLWHVVKATATLCQFNCKAWGIYCTY